MSTPSPELAVSRIRAEEAAARALYEQTKLDVGEAHDFAIIALSAASAAEGGEPAYYHNGAGQMLSAEALAMQDAGTASRFVYPLYDAPYPAGYPEERPLEWLDATEGDGCPIRFQAWPLRGYRIFLYQYGEADQWAAQFGAEGGKLLPNRGNEAEAKAFVAAEYADALRAAFQPFAESETIRQLQERASEAEALIALIREEASKNNAPLGRSNGLALDRIRTALSAHMDEPK